MTTVPCPPGYMHRKALPSSSAWIFPAGVNSPPHLSISTSEGSESLDVLASESWLATAISWPLAFLSAGSAQQTVIYTSTYAHTHTHTCAHAHTHTHTHLKARFPGLSGWAGTRKVKPTWILLKQETVNGSGISWAICKSAPRSRQITTPAPHHSVFYRPDALPAAQPTASKHWRHFIYTSTLNNYQKQSHHTKFSFPGT